MVIKFDENYKKNQHKKQDFLKFKWSAWKLLDCRILPQIPQRFWGPCPAPITPAVIAPRCVRCATRVARLRVSVTPLWKFLSTGLLYNISTMRKLNITIFYRECYNVLPLVLLRYAVTSQQMLLFFTLAVIPKTYDG